MSRSLNRREFLGRTGRGAAMAGGILGVGVATPDVAMAQTTEQANPPATGAQPAQGFLVGWASTSITADKPVQLQGQFHERVSERVLDPCMATALALERGGEDGEQAILVSCDIVGIDRDVVEDVRKRVAEQVLDFDARKLILHATHTHTGACMIPGSYKDPDPGVMGPIEYRELFVSRVCEAVVQAWTARKPGSVSRALGHAAVGFCRLAKYEDGSQTMYGKTNDPKFRGLESGNDHSVELLCFRDGQQKLTGIAINVACPSQVVEGKLFVSADFWAPVREELKKLHSAELFVYPMLSAAGDQSPRDLVRRGRCEPDMRDEPGMREMGRRIVNAVQDALAKPSGDPIHDPAFKHHIEQLDLPARLATEEDVQTAREEIKRLTQAGQPKPGSSEARVLQRAQNVLDRYEKQGDAPTYSMDLHVVRLGDTAIATNPFELYLEYGQRIKARSNATQTLLLQLAQDRGKYLPTRTAVAGGAYSSRIADNRVGPEGGDVLVERTVEAINSLWTEA